VSLNYFVLDAFAGANSVFEIMTLIFDVLNFIYNSSTTILFTPLTIASVSFGDHLDPFGIPDYMSVSS
jgi:hypothetical protein